MEPANETMELNAVKLHVQGDQAARARVGLVLQFLTIWLSLCLLSTCSVQGPLVSTEPHKEKETKAHMAWLTTVWR